VWGVPCNRISAEWGAQRIKGLSVWSTVTHAFKKLLPRGRAGGIGQKDTQTSLIEQFLYPKLGPGQMWEEVARLVKEKGGEIHTGYAVDAIGTDGWQVKSLEATNSATGAKETFTGDYFFSTAPIQELMRWFDVPPPENVREVSEGLVYRDFMTVGLLMSSLKIHDESRKARN
jgi:protoporphyrinogen oxidase